MNSLFIQIPNFGRSWGRGLSWGENLVNLGEKLGKTWGITWQLLFGIGVYVFRRRGSSFVSRSTSFGCLWSWIPDPVWPRNCNLGVETTYDQCSDDLLILDPRFARSQGNQYESSQISVAFWQLLSRKLTYGKSPFSSSMDFPIKPPWLWGCPSHVWF